MKIAYFDCPTGIAGDMCLGALVDAGVPLVYLQEKLGQLAIRDEFHLHSAPVKKMGIQGTQVSVDLNKKTEPVWRNLPVIERMIQAAQLPERAATWALAIFRCLAEAEGAVHGVAPEEVHFHEVGAVDAIVDIVGTSLGLDWLGIEKVICSPLPFGGGTVTAAHGKMPVPTPAVLKMWKTYQVPIFSNGIYKELVTPTGSAIVCALASQFGECPTMAVRTVGMGAGERNIAMPNLLRLWVGEDMTHEHHDSHAHTHTHDHHHHAHEEVVTVLETQVDDLSPQIIGYLFEKLLGVGVLDLYITTVGMKKNRPGLLLTVLCTPQKVLDCEELLFRETTTLGIRRHYVLRSVLGRRFETVTTDYGAVAVKVGFREDTDYTVQPEFEDCHHLAQTTGQPLKTIHQAALTAYSQSRCYP